METWSSHRSFLCSQDKDWLCSNRHVFIESIIPVPRILDQLFATSSGRLFHPCEDDYQVVHSKATPRDQIRALLDALTASTLSNAVQIFQEVLDNVCPEVLTICTQPPDILEELRSALDNIYSNETKETLLGWLDDQYEEPCDYILNTCLLEKSEAEKLMTDRSASSVAEQERQDYLYAKPAKEKLIRLESVFEESSCKRSITEQGRFGSPPTFNTNSSGSALPPTASGMSHPQHLLAGKHVGIYAAAGCGKTSCCSKITSLHASGKLWSNFRVVLFWKLREPGVWEAEDLTELLHVLVPSATLDHCQQIADVLWGTNGRNVLIILDGIDELLAKENAFVRRLLAGSALPEACLLATSRPCALATKYLRNYHLNLELLGFTEEQVTQFVERHLGRDLGAKLSKFLDDNENLACLMSVPLLSLFICEVFRLAPDNPPSTRTALYSKLLALLARQAADKGRVFIPDDEYDRLMATFDSRNLQGKAKVLLLELSQLASLAHQKNRIIFDQQLVDEAKCSDEALRLGVVSGKSGKTTQQYSFIHLTIQEFLAAYFLADHISVKCPQPEAQHQITQSKQSKTRTPSQHNQTPLRPVSNFFKRQFNRSDKQRRYKVIGHESECECALTEVMKSILSSRHQYVVLQFLGGMLPTFLLQDYFSNLNRWLHTNWYAGTWQGESEAEADSRHRLLTCLQCVREACSEKDVRFPRSLWLPNKIVLHHTTAADTSLLAKTTMKTHDVARLELSFDAESLQGEGDKSSRMQRQNRQAMTLLISTLRTCSVAELYVDGPKYRLFETKGVELLCHVVRYTNLETLCIFRCSLKDEEVADLARAVKNNDTLAVLSLNNNSLNTHSMHSIADAVTTNTELTKLGLSENGISDDGVCLIARALKQNSSLTTLSLASNNIGDRGACAIANALKINTTLKTLVLKNNHIADKGVCAIANALTTTSMVSTLFLHTNQIGDRGAAAMAAMLKRNKSLSALWLHDNMIGDDGACSLCDALETNRTVSELWLHGNPYSESSRQRLYHLSHIRYLNV